MSCLVTESWMIYSEALLAADNVALVQKSYLCVYCSSYFTRIHFHERGKQGVSRRNRRETIDVRLPLSSDVNMLYQCNRNSFYKVGS